MSSSFNALYLTSTFEVLTYEPKFFRYEFDFFRDTGLFPATVSVVTLTHNVIGDQPTIGLRQAVSDQVLIVNQLGGSFCPVFMQSWVEAQIAPVTRNLVSQHIIKFKPLPSNFISEGYRVSGHRLISNLYLQVFSPIDQLSYLYFTSPCSVTGQASIHFGNPGNFTNTLPAMRSTPLAPRSTPLIIDYSQWGVDNPGLTAYNAYGHVQHAILASEHYLLVARNYILTTQNSLLMQGHAPGTEGFARTVMENAQLTWENCIQMADNARLAAGDIRQMVVDDALNRGVALVEVDNALLQGDVELIEVDNALLRVENARLEIDNDRRTGEYFVHANSTCHGWVPFYGSTIDLNYWDTLNKLYREDQKLTNRNRSEHIDLFGLNAQGTLHQPYSTSFADCETFVQNAPEWGGLHIRTHPCLDPNSCVLLIDAEGYFRPDLIPNFERVQSVYQKTSNQSLDNLLERVYHDLKNFAVDDIVRESMEAAERFIEGIKHENLVSNRNNRWMFKPKSTRTHDLDLSQSLWERYTSRRQKIRIKELS